MHLALLTTFAASRKEPLAEDLERVHTAIIVAGLGEPYVRFAFADSPIPGRVSSVDRVLRRFPSLQPFARSRSARPGNPETKVIFNRTATGAIGETVDFATLMGVARGVPRSFPFHNVGLHLTVPAFSSGVELPTAQPALRPGIDVGQWASAICHRPDYRRGRTYGQEAAAASRSRCVAVRRLRQGAEDSSGPTRHGAGATPID
jgi:hypothetical protein